MLQMSMRNCIAVSLLGVLGLTASLARADYMATVSMDTTPFQSLPSGDVLTIYFSLTDDSNGDGVNNNTATITNLNVGSGSLDTSSFSTNGSASSSNNDLTGTVTLTDNSGLNSVQENFTTVGSNLSFNLDLTTNVSSSEGGGAPFGPDSFAFTILDSQGLINYDSPTSNFLDIYITGSPPTVSPSGGSILPNGPDIPAPLVSSAPEPSTLVLLLSGAGLAGAASARTRFGRRKRCAALDQA